MPPDEPPRSAADPLVGTILDGRYRIDSLLGAGGIATMYRGADLLLDRPVAIKVMHPSFALNPGFVDRFERAARAAARLHSPYVVAVHDQGNEGGVTYLVMEYVHGHTLRDLQRTYGALQPAQALAILEPVLEALAAAHRAGYVHYDITPENVLISDEGRVKVTDFGLARAIEGTDSGRAHGMPLGTVAYLSPEQVEHDITDARSDVYSAGILLFELVTGQVPFPAAAPTQVTNMHVHEDVPAPSTVRPDIPEGIDQLVLRATRRSPDRRFPHAAAFLAEVRVLRAALPPRLSPPPSDKRVVSREPVASETDAGEGIGAGVAGAAAGVVEGGSAAASVGLIAGATDPAGRHWRRTGGRVTFMRSGGARRVHPVAAVHDSDVEGLLRRLRVPEEGGRVRCSFCGGLVEKTEIGALVPDGKRYILVCSAPACFVRAVSVHERTEGS